MLFSAIEGQGDGTMSAAAPTLSSGDHAEPATSIFDGRRLDLLGFVFHLSWMYLFLYDQASANWFRPLSTSENQVLDTGLSFMYICSTTCLAATLAVFFFAERRVLRHAGNRVLRAIAPTLAAVGTAVYCLPLAFPAIDVIPVALASGALTGIGSGILAARWAHAFGAAGPAAIIESLPTMIAAILTICATAPYLPRALGLVVVIALPLLSGRFATHATRTASFTGADAAGIEAARQADRSSNRYLAIAACAAIMGAIIGFINRQPADTSAAGYLPAFDLSVTVAVLALSALHLHRTRPQQFAVSFAVPTVFAICVFVLFMQVSQRTWLESFLPIGSICLELLFFSMLILTSHRFDLSAVRVFTLGRICYAAASIGGALLSARLALGGESMAMQISNFVLFAGIEIVGIAAIAAVMLARPAKRATAVKVDERDEERVQMPCAEQTMPEPARVARFKDRLTAFADSYGLSAREVDVLEQIVQGRTAARIQEKLHIAEGTVNYHTRNIHQKVGVHTKQDLIDLFDEQTRRR